MLQWYDDVESAPRREEPPTLPEAKGGLLQRARAHPKRSQRLVACERQPTPGLESVHEVGEGTAMNHGGNVSPSETI